ncbi:MAG: hypothetical protein IPM94_11825 [bacterium]|nr:hypothetical protein [bacterium]
MKDIASGAERELEPRRQQGIRSPLFSPDGDVAYYAMAGPKYSLGYYGEYDVYRLNLTEGRTQRVLTGIIGRRFDCSPDGQRLAFMRSAGDSVLILVAHVNGTEVRRLGARPRDISEPPCLAFSADGLRVYTTERDTAGGKFAIVAHTLDGHSTARLAGGPWQTILDLQSVSDGGLLVVGQPAGEVLERQTDLWLLPAGADRPQRLTRDLHDYLDVSVDRSGRRLAAAYAMTKRTIRVLGVDHPDRYTDISTDIVKNGKVTWTRAGQLLVTQRFGNRVGLVVMNSDGRERHQIPVDVDYVADVDMSDDGRRLAYAAWEGTDFTVWLAAADGTSPLPVAAPEVIDQFPRFAPDGSWLLYGEKPAAGGSYILMRHDLRNRTTIPLSEWPGIWPDISPDGSRIAAYFKDPAGGAYRLGLLPAGGGVPELLGIDGAFSFLCWNPRGTGLTCYVREVGTPNIWDVPLDGSPPRRLTDFQPGHLNMPDLDWNAAGDSLVVVLETPEFNALMLESTR